MSFFSFYLQLHEVEYKMVWRPVGRRQEGKAFAGLSETGIGFCTEGPLAHGQTRLWTHVEDKRCLCWPATTQSMSTFLNPARRRRDGVKEDYYV